MALTKSFRETLGQELRNDRAFRVAYLDEAIGCLHAGDLATGKAMLRDFIRTGHVLYIAPAPNEAARLRIAYAPAILLGTLMSQWFLGQLDPLISRLEF